MSTYTKAIVFYNTRSGHSRFEKHQGILQKHFQERAIDLKIVEVPKPADELKQLVLQAMDEGVGLFIAAGGDGTASMVGNPLIGTSAHMGILPLGTGNLLAKELKIPSRFEKALALITTDNPTVIQMDTFRLDGQYYLLNMSTGVTPRVMGGTESEEKKRFGILAYFVHFVEQVLGLKRHRFEITLDGRHISCFASEILVTNSRSTILDPLTWADTVKLNDGALDMFIFRAANIFDIASLVVSLFTKRQHMSPVVEILPVVNQCRITSQVPMPTQADGDPIGETPAEIWVNPNSLNVIVGKPNIYEIEQRSKK